jgi:O-antigen/teichoic acid export membrane protein
VTEQTNNTKTSWLQSGLFSLLEKLSVPIFGFGTLMLLARMFPKEDMGVWLQFVVLTSIMEMSRAGLIQNAVVKYLSTAQTTDEKRDINTASLSINIFVTILMTLAILLGAGYISEVIFKMPNLKYMLWMYIAHTWILAPLFQFNYIQQSYFDFRGVFWGNFVKQGAFFLFVFSCFLLHNVPSLTTLIIAQGVTSFLAVLISYHLAKQYLQFGEKLNWDWITKLFHFGKYVFATNLSTMIYKNMDGMMLAALVGPAAAANMNICARVNNLMEVPTGTVASLVYPQSAKKIEQEGKGAIKDLYEKSVGAIIAVLLPLVGLLLMFPKAVILVIGGYKYLDAVPILQLVAFYGLFMPFAVQFGTVLDSIGMPRTNFIVTFITACMNICMNYLCVKQFGVIGAVYGTLTTYTIMFVVMQTLLNRIIGTSPINVLKYIPYWYNRVFDMIAARFIKGKPVL